MRVKLSQFTSDFGQGGQLVSSLFLFLHRAARSWQGQLAKELLQKKGTRNDDKNDELFRLDRSCIKEMRRGPDAFRNVNGDDGPTTLSCCSYKLAYPLLRRGIHFADLKCCFSPSPPFVLFASFELYIYKVDFPFLFSPSFLPLQSMCGVTDYTYMYTQCSLWFSSSIFCFASWHFC